jgi:hypothetical protein
MAAIALKSFALQIYLYLTVAEVIESMSTPHDDSNNEGNSNVKLMGGGW